MPDTPDPAAAPPAGPARGLVLVTRPEPGAAETARRLAARGYTPVLAPVSVIVPRRLAIPACVQAVLATSANALAGLEGAIPPGLPFLAVGDATAARARAAGFRRVASAGKDAAALAELAAARCAPGAGPLLLLAGEGQGLALAAALRARGFAVRRRVAYAARPARTLGDLSALAAGPGHALFFSPESARRFGGRLPAALRPALARWEALAISPATAAALAPLPWRRIRVASHPDQDALLALLP